MASALMGPQAMSLSVIPIKASRSTAGAARFSEPSGFRQVPFHDFQRRRRDRAVSSPISCALTEEKEGKGDTEEDLEAVTRKWGLEAGLWKAVTSKRAGGGEDGDSKSTSAKDLLARYGGAYLATSITLSVISFALCYVLVDAGVDVPALLAKVGIESTETGGKVGTFALAYAAHKAASPVRFPPTVALTPVVARWLGKKVA